MAITRDKLLTHTRRMLYTLKKVQQLPNLPPSIRQDVERSIRETEDTIGEEVTQEEVRPGECIAGQGRGTCRCPACLDKRFARATTPSALW